MKHRENELKVAAWNEEIKRLEAELATERERREKAVRRATDAEYLAQAYRNMLGEKGRTVADRWQAKGVKRVHIDWASSAAHLTGEERAQTILDFESAPARLVEDIDRDHPARPDSGGEAELTPGDQQVMHDALKASSTVRGSIVAWECWGEKPGEWKESRQITYDRETAEKRSAHPFWTVRPLYAAPPASAPVVLEKRPVAFRVKDFADDWILFHNEGAAQHVADASGAVMQGLYVRDGSASAPAVTDEMVLAAVEGYDVEGTGFPENASADHIFRMKHALTAALAARKET